MTGSEGTHFSSGRGVCLVAFTLLCLLGSAMAAMCGEPPLLTTRDIQSLSFDASRPSVPARIRGVVTFSSKPMGAFFVEDASGGIYCDLGGVNDWPGVGEEVELEGIAVEASFKPILAASGVRVLGTSRVPQPRKLSRVQLTSGDYDGDYVRVTGYLSAAFGGRYGFSLRLICDGNEVLASVPGDPSGSTSWTNAVHAEIEVVGALGAVAAGERQLAMPRVFVSSTTNVRLLRSASEVTRMLPTQAIEQMQRRPDSVRDGLVRTRGVVIWAGAGAIWLGTPEGGMHVGLRNPRHDFKVGEDVEVVGFLATSGGRRQIRSAVSLSRVPSVVPASVGITHGSLADPALVGRRVRLECDILHYLEQGAENILVCQAGRTRLDVHLPFSPSDAQISSWVPGSSIRVTGVLDSPLPQSTPSTPSSRPSILVSSAGDFHWLGAAPWPSYWTLPLVSVLLGVVLIGCVVLALGHRRLRVLNSSLRRTELELKLLNSDLARRVRSATCEWEDANARLQTQIRDRRVAEEALSVSERRLRTLVEGTEMVLWEFAPHTDTFTYVSPQAGRLGYPLERWLEAGFWGTIIHAEDRAWAMEFCRTHALVGLPYRFQYRMMKADGGVVWVDDVVTVGTSEEGLPLLRGVLIDITDSKAREAVNARLEGRLIQAQKMEAIGTLAGGIAHDFNNLLTSILGNADMALREVAANAPAAEGLHDVIRAGRRARELVKQILTFSRQGAPSMGEVRIEEVLRESLRLLRPSIPSSICLDVDADECARPVMGNFTQVQQVIVNLTTNAIQAMGSSPGRIHITLRPAVVATPGSASPGELNPGDYTVLGVRDQGPGIDPSMMDRIFEPFFTTKMPGVGTGLGLSVVHGIVRSHGGAVLVESRPGKGTLFEVYLPCCHRPNGTAAAAEGKAEPLARGRLLLVDDEPSILRWARMVLEREGHSVATTDDPGAVAGLIWSDEVPFDLVITDFQMSGMTGRDVLCEVRRSGRPSSVMLFTGHASAPGWNQAVEEGFCGVVRKPVEREEFCEAVSRALGGRVRPATPQQDAGTRIIQAFTLIEVLVVVAVIGILAGLLLPALGRAKARSLGTSCAGNVRQLHLAWTMYADERSGMLVNNHGIQETIRRRENWVNNVLDWGQRSDNTNLATLTSGLLTPYLSQNTAVFKCPADRSTAENGDRIRSYSMNSMVGDPGELTNRFNPHLLQNFKMTDFARPSETYVFLDEHPDTLNDGFFMNRWAEYKWGNLPASHHDGSGNLSFADGHVERHKWVEVTTLKPSIKGGSGGVFPAEPPRDYDWLRERTSTPRR